MSADKVFFRERLDSNMGSNILVMNTTSHETRVALVENGTISEFFLERNSERGTAGNIYKGKGIYIKFQTSPSGNKQKNAPFGAFLNG